ncbi:MAG: hypothetical protein ACTSU5_15970 [Promethearchaeota archaeon]
MNAHLPILPGYPEGEIVLTLALLFAGFWAVSVLVERVFRGRDVQSKRSKVVSWVFFPGVVLHEVAHALAYVATNFKWPVKVELLRNTGGLANGRVVPDKIDSPTASFLVTFAPLLVMAPMAYLLLLFSTTNWPRMTSDLRVACVYLLLVLVLHARPSGPDLRALRHEVSSSRGALAREIVALLGGASGALILARAGMVSGWTTYAACLASALAWQAVLRALYRERKGALRGAVSGSPKHLPPRVGVPDPGDMGAFLPAIVDRAGVSPAGLDHDWVKMVEWIVGTGRWQALREKNGEKLEKKPGKF